MKKIFSFFLAIVMLFSVTAGIDFSAYANDSNQKELYATLGKAATIDYYEAILSNFDDKIAQLSPNLLKEFSITDPATVISTVDSTTSKDWYDTYYSYLDGTDDDVFDFYSLYQFCINNLNANGDLGVYCQETLPALKELLAGYLTVKEEYTDAYCIGAEKVYAYYDEMASVYDYDTTTMVSKQMVRDFEIDGVKFGEIVDPECDTYFNYVKDMFAYIGSNAVIENLADAAYYSMGNGSFDLVIDLYLMLINEAGATITLTMFDPTATTPITSANYLEEIKKHYTYDVFLAEMGMTPEDAAAMQDMVDEMYNLVCKSMIYNIIACDENGTEEYGIFGSAYYRELTMGFMQFVDITDDVATTVADEEITDEQLQAFIDYAYGAFGDPATFVSGKPNVDVDAVIDYFTTRSWFSPYVVETLIGLPNSDIIAWARIAALEGATPADLRAYKINTHGLLGTDSTYRLKDMTLVDRANYMISSAMIIDDYGTGYLGYANSVAIPSLFVTLYEYENGIKPILEANYAYEYDKYAIPDELTVEAVNSLLNGHIDKLLDPNGANFGGVIIDIAAIIDACFDTDIDLNEKLTNIWLNLYDDYPTTITELLPTVAVIADEFVIPLLFNEAGDSFNGTLYSLLCTDKGVFTKYTQDAGDTTYGIGSLSFNLNVAVPAVLNWLIGNEQTAIDLVGTYTGDVYDNYVPKFFNVYALDKVIADTSDLDENEITVLQILLDSVDTYLEEHSEDARYNQHGDILHSGINNIGVAIPQVLDIFANNITTYYGDDADYTNFEYCYEGKIELIEKSFVDDYYGNTVIAQQYENTTIANFKALAVDGSVDNITEYVGEYIYDEAFPMYMLIADVLSDCFGYDSTTAILDIVADVKNIEEDDYRADKYDLSFEKIIDSSVGHQEIIVPGYDATCTDTGLTEGAYCILCATNTVEQGIIDTIAHDYATVVTSPTCTEDGRATHTCVACGDTYDEVIYSTGHSGELLEIIEPICDEDGYSVYKCSVCGEEYEDNYVDANGHSYNETVIPPTCIVGGYTVNTCEVCGYSYNSSYVESTGHTYASEVTAPNCTTYTCTICDYSYLDDGSVTTHGDYEYRIDEDGTVSIKKYIGSVAEVTIPSTFEGYLVTNIDDKTFYNNNNLTSITIPNTVTRIGDGAFYGCTSLTDIYYLGTETEWNEIAIEVEEFDNECLINADIHCYCEPDNHDYNSTVNEPTCTQDGLITYTCLICGYSYTESISATGHNYKGVVTAPTCTEQGFTTYTCSVCGDNYIDDTVTALGHSYDSVVTEPTCTKDGYTTYTCSVCDDTYVADEVRAIGHNYNAIVIAPTCTTGGYTTYTCSNCDDSYTGDYVDVLGHTYDTGVTTTQPTYDEPGVMTYTCSVCQNSYTQDIPKLEKIGWFEENGKWTYYDEGIKLTNQWMQDSVGWCYLGADGYMVTNSWIMDSVGWCYVGADGYCLTNTWMADSVGWCYLDADGRMATNQWIMDSVGWCYVGADGYCITNSWVKDSVGWCYLDANGRMVYNQWVQDSIGWCYVGADGYMVCNQWVYYGNNWYYVDNDGYMVTGTRVINGKTYLFNSNGVFIE